MLQRCIITTVTVITQPDNTTACAGDTVMFACVINTSSVNISTEDISWWRIRRDHNNNSIRDPLMISQHGIQRIRINKTNNGEDITSVLTITNVRSSDAGPYWLRLMDTKNTAVAFLSIIPDGMYIYVIVYICM